MNDLVERLQNIELFDVCGDITSIGQEAADELTRLNSQCLRLRAENAELRADAERYRCLRKESCPLMVFIDGEAINAFDYLVFERLDKAIDAVLQGEQP